MRSIDFYFDYLSPYAYLASRKIAELCRRHTSELRWRPVLFAGLLNHWGQRGPAEIPPKAVHTFKECVRHARLHEIPFCMPRHHPFKPLTALRVSLPEVSGRDQPRVVRALFDLGWAHGGDMGDPDAIRETLDSIGLDGLALVAGAESADAKDQLRRETEDAIARGVFGIPTMGVDEELFWGLDQLEYLELYLEGRDPLQSSDWDQSNFRGPSAWRTGVPRHDTESD